ncbi:MAG: hypothetical protein K2L89_04495, partial [Muribaculaceae bacterium]|nr:hypothetical protein [Muribaculaceae bacterium]
MKRLTKDERTGATAIALVALVVCLGSIFLSRRNRVEPAPRELVETIILATDSLSERSGKSDESEVSEKTRKKDKKLKVKKKEEGSSKRKNKKGGGGK